MSDDLESLLERARSGDRDSLERLVEQIQGPVYNLALRMLWHPEDARDATQDILIRVITHLGSFRGDSRVQTWVYRVAANYLISARQGRVEAQGYTFDRFANDLHDGLAEVGADLLEARADLRVGEGLDLCFEIVGLVDERLDPFQLAVVRVDESGKEAKHGR